MQTCVEGYLNAQNKRFALVVSRFNSFISERLLEGAMDALKRHGAAVEEQTVVRVPGAFEVPLVAKRLALTGKYHGIICLGAVIRGSTPHFDYVSAEVSKGIAAVSLEQNLPVAFGILTTDTLEQAIERAGSKAGNKGAEAALGAVETADVLQQVAAL